MVYLHLLYMIQLKKTSDLERKSKIYDMYGKHRTQNQKDKETRKYN